jgi:hypothetical protein
LLSHYDCYDSLESNADLADLFETLDEFRDATGRPPVVTGVCIVGNPDFRRIKSNGFQQYYWEPFTETLQRYPNHDMVAALWREGAARRLFVPQLHGREHLNVTAWMKALQGGQPKTRLAFDQDVTGIDSVALGESRIQFQAAFDIDDPSEVEYLRDVIREAQGLFERIMGYRATYFVPANGPFNLGLLQTLAEVGISYLVLDKLQREPIGHCKYRTHLRWLGWKSECGQVLLSRNASFEPSAGGEDCVGACLNDIARAFRWRKPATVSTHRVNYIGTLDRRNREKGLKLLRQALGEILKRWPAVEFLTSKELGDLIIADCGYSQSGLGECAPGGRSHWGLR